MKNSSEIKDLLYNKIPLILLSHLTKNANNGNVYGTKVADELEISQSGASIVLKQFKSMGILTSENIGKTVVYNMNSDNALVKSFRVFENLLELNDLVQNINQYCRKIILFGSCCRGEDTVNSDIDLFIVADDDNKDTVRNIISGYEIDRDLKPVIVNALEVIDMESTDKVFLNEVEKGIELWGGRNE